MAIPQNHLAVQLAALQIAQQDAAALGMIRLLLRQGSSIDQLVQSRGVPIDAFVEKIRLGIVTENSLVTNASGNLVPMMTFPEFMIALKVTNRRFFAKMMPKSQEKNMVTRDQVVELLKRAKSTASPYCLDMSKLRCHAMSKESLSKKSGITCAWCGEKVWQRCGICGVGLHYVSSPDTKHQLCFYLYHSFESFGLGRFHSAAMGRHENETVYPSEWDLTYRRAILLELKAQIENNNQGV